MNIKTDQQDFRAECNDKCFIDLIENTMSNLADRVPKSCQTVIPPDIDDFIFELNNHIQRLPMSFPKNEVIVAPNCNTLKLTFKEHSIYMTFSGFNLRTIDLDFSNQAVNFYKLETMNQLFKDYILTPFSIHYVIATILNDLIINPYGVSYNKPQYYDILTYNTCFRDIKGNEAFRSVKATSDYNISWQYPAFASYVNPECKVNIDEYPCSYFQVNNVDVINAKYFFVVRHESYRHITKFTPCENNEFDTLTKLTDEFIKKNPYYTNECSDHSKDPNRINYSFIISDKGEILSNYILKF